MNPNKPNLKLCSNHYPPRQSDHPLCLHSKEFGHVVGSEPSPGTVVTAIDGKRYRMTTQGNLVRLNP